MDGAQLAGLMGSGADDEDLAGSRQVGSAVVPSASPAGLSHQVTITPAPRAPIRAMLARAMVRRAVRRLPFSITVPGGGSAGTRWSGEPVLRLLRPEAFYRRLGASGLIGFGEAFQAGDWDSDDLPGLLTVFAAGVDAIIPPWLQRVRGHSAAPRRPLADEQTIGGARRNARHHYALPDELFREFLDETMCYSSAIFAVGADGRVIAEDAALAEAQRRKIDRLLDLAGVRDGTRVLEIGTGWGELAVRAAQRGALVHAVTNMAEHAEFARDRASRAGVTRQVRVDVLDYRELVADDGGYDAILSVEMIEAVGRRYWPAYFRLAGWPVFPPQLPPTNPIANTFAAWRLPASYSVPLGTEPMYCAFWSNAMPAEIEIELGLLEPKVLQTYLGLGNATAQSNYLSSHAASVHLFRQRIHLENVDPKAY